jgi:GT2 family glycosyltransferase
MRISIIVATFDRAALLRDCLDRLVAQAYLPGDEIIVVDNASTDGTPEVIRQAALKSPVPLRYVRETQPGKTPALNAGIAISAGDVLALTDDDIVVADDWVATVRRIFAEDDQVVLVGGRVDPRWERPAPRWLPIPEEQAYGRMTSPLALLHYGDRQPLGARTAIGANLAVRRSVLRAVGGFMPSLGRLRGTLLCGEDHDFCQRVSAAGYRCEYRPELRVRHWVPAERLNLRYYARWFYWSGITNARLEARGAGRKVPKYLWKRLVTGPPIAASHLLRGRLPETVAVVMDTAFVVGYIRERRWPATHQSGKGLAHPQEEGSPPQAVSA